MAAKRSRIAKKTWDPAHQEQERQKLIAGLATGRIVELMVDPDAFQYLVDSAKENPIDGYTTACLFELWGSFNGQCRKPDWIDADDVRARIRANTAARRQSQRAPEQASE